MADKIDLQSARNEDGSISAAVDILINGDHFNQAPNKEAAWESVARELAGSRAILRDFTKDVQGSRILALASLIDTLKDIEAAFDAEAETGCVTMSRAEMRAALRIALAGVGA
jgi:hypothetical protein